MRTDSPSPRAPIRLLVAVLLFVAACSDPLIAPTDRAPGPVGPSSPAEVSAAVTPTENSPCNVRWASGVNGSWFDAARWDPAGVPGAASSVCVDAAGTYTITMDPTDDAVPIGILGLDLGGAGASPTLRLAGNNLTLAVWQGVRIRAGATLHFFNVDGGIVSAGGTLTNEGIISVSAQCGGCGLNHGINADILNQGTWNHIQGSPRTTLGKPGGAYRNLGTIDLTNNSSIRVPSGLGAVTFEQDGGAIAGTGNFPMLTLGSGTFQFRGGEAGQRTNQRPIVMLDGASLGLEATATEMGVFGMLASSSGAAPTITGDIAPLTTLWVSGPADGQPGSIHFQGSPTNAGLIFPVFQIDSPGGPLTLGGAGRLTNTGTISQSRSSGSQRIFRYDLELTNNGTIIINDGTTVALTKPGGVYHNNGSIQNSAFLRIGEDATLVQSPSGSTVPWESGGIGTVTVDGGRLVGSGTVHSRVLPISGGTIEPGASPGILTTWFFEPDATGRLRVELGGTTPGTQYDRLVTTGLSFQGLGVLEVVEVGGFQAGVCGQLFEIISHGNAASANSWSPFGTTIGLSPSPGRQMRVVYRRATGGGAIDGSVILVGFDGSQKICVGPTSVAIAEGGPGASYAITLEQAPAANVTVNLVANDQITVSPTSLVFTPANWEIPQFVTVTAVDDNIPEGNHTGSVTHSVTTADPFYQSFVPAALTANITDNDVNLPPVAANDIATTDEDTSVDIDVLANDSDPDADPLTIAALTAPAHGTASIHGTLVRYTPAQDYNGQDSFGYTVADGKGGTAGATVAVTVMPVNDPPVAVNDHAVTRSPSPVTIPVLENDHDVDGDALFVIEVTQPNNGTAVISSSSAVTYSPAPGFIGSDSFGYAVADGQGGMASATVTVDVLPETFNRPPAAIDDVVVITTSSGSIFIDVLANDTDPDGDRLRITNVFGATNGTATINGFRVRYTITNPAAGQDQFAYTITDSFSSTCCHSTAVVRVSWPVPPPEMFVDYSWVEVRVDPVGKLPTNPSNYSMYAVHGVFSAPWSVFVAPGSVTVQVEIELPSGTLAVGRRVKFPEYLEDLAPIDGCTAIYSGRNLSRYRCELRHGSPPNPYWVPIPPAITIAVADAGPRSFRVGYNLVPVTATDPNRRNNSATVTVQKP
jgi:hypothetical protein